MADTVTRSVRSRIMAAVKQKDTAPEMVVRRLLHSLGYRYRLHCRNLPGTPDLVFPSRRKIVFVSGCFWHAHRCRRGCAPRSRRQYWLAKFARNKRRDEHARRALRRLGWDVLTVWECQTRQSAKLREQLTNFLTA